MKHKSSALQGRRKHNYSDENLSVRIIFRLSPVEQKSLEEKAEDRGLKLSLLCRLIVMCRKIPDRSPQTLQWFRDLVGIQNNLNQIAHNLNITIEPDQWAIEVIRFIRNLIAGTMKTPTQSPSNNSTVRTTQRSTVNGKLDAGNKTSPIVTP